MASRSWGPHGARRCGRSRRHGLSGHRAFGSRRGLVHSARPHIRSCAHPARLWPVGQAAHADDLRRHLLRRPVPLVLRSCCQFARDIASRLSDLNLSRRPRARAGSGSYTRRSHPLHDAARNGRLFHVLYWASVCKRYRAVSPDARLSLFSSALMRPLITIPSNHHLAGELGCRAASARFGWIRDRSRARGTADGRPWQPTPRRRDVVSDGRGRSPGLVAGA